MSLQNLKFLRLSDFEQIVGTGRTDRQTDGRRGPNNNRMAHDEDQDQDCFLLVGLAIKSHTTNTDDTIRYDTIEEFNVDSDHQ